MQTKQFLIGFLMVVGVTLIVCGGLLSLMLFGGGAGQYIGFGDERLLNLAGLGLGIILIGILLALGGLGYGLWLTRRAYKGPVVVYPHVRVVAKYVLNRDGEMVSSYYYDLVEGARFYVRLDLGNRRSEEFECPRELFERIGEGVLGEATCQGQWLGAFKPYIGA